MSYPTQTKLAYSPGEVKQAGGPGKTKVYQAINNGELVAHKLGSRTIILAPDLEQYLSSLPAMEVDNADAS